MTSSSSTTLVVILSALAACGGSGTPGTGNAGGNGTDLPNVLAVTVNGSTCSAFSYPNKPCVAITLCAPGTTTCQTIDDILLDTGSSGLRIFKQVIRVPLQQATTGGAGALAECVQWGDATSDWGPVQLASVRLGTEPAVELPIHVIDSTFGTPPPACGTPDVDPATAGFNGILGLGVFVQDCGGGCATDAANGVYYSCTGTTCQGTAVALANQVANPVSLLPVDNNGVVVSLPAVPTGGAASVSGQVLLGIGTRSNNVPAKPTVLALDGNGYFSARFNGGTYNSFVDTGSNGLFFPQPASGMPPCPSPNGSWFCPQSTVSLSATIVDGKTGTTSSTISFQVANYLALIAGPNYAFGEIGGPASTQLGFDWGMPFHFGRLVYVGLEGARSSLGTGPYFAY